RYQKFRNLSLYSRPSRRHAGLALALCAGLLAACSGHPEQAGQAVTQSTDAPPLASFDLRRSLVPFDPDAVRQLAVLQPSANASSAPQRPLVPPAARQAVVDAYEARKKKQFSAMQNFVAPAQSDPVLGVYPQYWVLSQQLQDSTRPISEPEIQRFLVNSDNA